MDYHSVIENYISLPPAIITPAVSTIFIFVLVMLFFFSFLLSGAQVAYFSLTLKDINLLKTRQQPSYRRIVNLLENPRILMTGMLIGNTIVNIGIILIGNLLMDEWIYQLNLPDWVILLIKILIIALFIVAFAEILPKVWATHHKIQFASLSSMVVEITNRIFYKISKQVVWFNHSIENAMHNGSSRDTRHLDYDIDLLPEEEATTEEKQILKGIRKFGNTTVKQTMRTRLDVMGIEVSNTYPQTLEKVREMIYSRIPVYKGNLDEIIGILHTKDLLPHLSQTDFDWQSLLRPVYYVHEQKLIEDLLQDFRSRRIHMAVVVDEFGGTSGIITLEDVIEEIVGDIQDEFDEEIEQNHRIDDHNYIFEGKMMIDDVTKYLRLAPNTFEELRGDSDSLAGLVLEIAGAFPEVNDEIKANGFTFRPTEINKNRILKVQVTLPNETSE